MNKRLHLLIILLWVISPRSFANYPQEWWIEIPRDQARSWEILPQDAKEGEVILSKRTELGIFSNFSYTPFCLNTRCYYSIEGFWQMMKYPENSADPRYGLGFRQDREDVSKLWGIKAKRAGSHANNIMKKHGIEWISYKGNRFNYKDFGDGSNFHYEVVYQAILAKVLQNDRVKSLLKKTVGLKLRPDHIQGEKPPSYYYHDILMKIRDDLF